MGNIPNRIYSTTWRIPLQQGNHSEFCATLWLIEKRSQIWPADPQVGSLPKPSEAENGESQRRKGMSSNGQPPVATTAAAWWNRRGQERNGLKPKKKQAFILIIEFQLYCISLNSSFPINFMVEGLGSQKTLTLFFLLGLKQEILPRHEY